MENYENFHFSSFFIFWFWFFCHFFQTAYRYLNCNRFFQNFVHRFISICRWEKIAILHILYQGGLSGALQNFGAHVKDRGQNFSLAITWKRCIIGIYNVLHTIRLSYMGNPLVVVLNLYDYFVTSYCHFRDVIKYKIVFCAQTKPDRASQCMRRVYEIVYGESA